MCLGDPVFREARRPAVWSARKTGAPAVPSKLGDEKWSVVILRPADYDEWLHTKNVDAARARCCRSIRMTRWRLNRRRSERIFLEDGEVAPYPTMD